MSKINELIKEMCPNGIKYYKLSEIGNQFNGLSGKSKKDFENGNCKYITYTNIYNNPSANLDVEDYVHVNENEKQNEIKYKDVLVAGSSENLEDSGMISVITKEPNEKIYLNSFCFGFRLNDTFYDKYNSDFLKHLFRDKNFRSEIVSCSFGVTRYNLSKGKFLKIKIPCPPLEVQEEIAKILDKFGELEAELQAELEARKRQYEFWCGKLLNMDYQKIKLLNLCDEVNNINWKNVNSTYKYIDLSSVDRENNQVVETSNISKENAPSRARQIIKTNDVLFGTTRPMLKRITLISQEYDNQICSTGYCVLRPNTKRVVPEWLYFNLQTEDFYKYVESFQQGASYPSISDNAVKKYEISLPPVDVQMKVINVLTKFDKLTNNISEGLPAEIELRRQQYEYYRNKLLSFEELKNE